jgi:hypothetical protein
VKQAIAIKISKVKTNLCRSNLVSPKTGFFLPPNLGLPDFYWPKNTKTGKVYQIATSYYTKRPYIMPIGQKLGILNCHKYIPDFFDKIYQNRGKYVYQITTNIPSGHNIYKWPENIPNDNKIFQLFPLQHPL